jgi:uncharacterized surface protein with fasciclin (FAS1) repeats
MLAGAGVAGARRPTGRGGPPSDGRTIVEVASGDDRFDTLVTALEATGLAATLDGNRQFTVFAPTDDAFDNVDVDALLNDLDGLEDILKLHVVPGRRNAASITGSDRVPTLLGETVAVDGTVLNDGQARIVDTNIRASNGFIHAIDDTDVDGAGVLLP